MLLSHLMPRKFLQFGILSISIVCGTALSAFGIDYSIVNIRAPAGLLFKINNQQVPQIPVPHGFKLALNPHLNFPFTLSATTPLGLNWAREINSPAETSTLTVPIGIITNKDTKPQKISTLPQLCPYLSNDNSYEQTTLHYDAQKDPINHFPIMHLLDADFRQGQQYKSFSEMDGKNTLELKKAIVRYDYEDTDIIDFNGPNPITGKMQTVHEGDGGFYASFHFAIIPFDQTVLAMDRQTLLHLAQGKLAEINKSSLTPPLRVHGFIPGPFLSKQNAFYSFCEWGDTTFQAPVQTMDYTSLTLWDWDTTVPNAQDILLIVWEGDEEDWLIQDQIIDPFYLTDDLVGIFEIKRGATLQPVTLKNAAGDFEITVQTKLQ